MYRSERVACLPSANTEGAAPRIWSSDSGALVRSTGVLRASKRSTNPSFVLSLKLRTLRLAINETDEVSMDRQQMERCLERVAAYRASGQTAKVWAEANDIPMRVIASWCAHSRR